jgi:hypothetical protein
VLFEPAAPAGSLALGIVDAHQEVHYPVFMCGLHLEPARSNHVEHVNVVAEDVGFELPDSLASRNAAQMDEEQCTDAASLVRIYDGKSRFAALLRSAKVTPDTYEVFATLVYQFPTLQIEEKAGAAARSLLGRKRPPESRMRRAHMPGAKPGRSTEPPHAGELGLNCKAG